MLLITIVSVAGRTITVTVAAALTRFGATVLVAVTVKVKVWAGVSSGTVGAVNVTGEPVVEDNATTEGFVGDGVQVKVELQATPAG
jgi:hypothetical protein